MNKFNRHITEHIAFGLQNEYDNVFDAGGA